MFWIFSFWRYLVWICDVKDNIFLRIFLKDDFDDIWLKFINNVYLNLFFILKIGVKYVGLYDNNYIMIKFI